METTTVENAPAPSMPDWAAKLVDESKAYKLKMEEAQERDNNETLSRRKGDFLDSIKRVIPDSAGITRSDLNVRLSDIEGGYSMKLTGEPIIPGVDFVFTGYSLSAVRTLPDGRVVSSGTLTDPKGLGHFLNDDAPSVYAVLEDLFAQEETPAVQSEEEKKAAKQRDLNYYANEPAFPQGENVYGGLTKREYLFMQVFANAQIYVDMRTSVENQVRSASNAVITAVNTALERLHINEPFEEEEIPVQKSSALNFLQVGFTQEHVAQYLVSLERQLTPDTVQQDAFEVLSDFREFLEETTGVPTDGQP